MRAMTIVIALSLLTPAIPPVLACGAQASAEISLSAAKKKVVKKAKKAKKTEKVEYMRAVPAK
jgi:hypothetical protein